MDLGLRDAKVVVTGGSAGMGRATEECCAQNGARVAVLARNPRALDETVAALQVAGSPEALGIATDLSRQESVERLSSRSVPAGAISMRWSTPSAPPPRSSVSSTTSTTARGRWRLI